MALALTWALLCLQSFQEGKSMCNGKPECCGITFESPDKIPTAALKIFLKSDCHPNTVIHKQRRLASL